MYSAVLTFTPDSQSFPRGTMRKIRTSKERVTIASILTLLLATASISEASLIASDSFAVTAGGYSDGVALRDAPNNSASTGVTGFSSNWVSNTGTIIVDDDVAGAGTGLSHSHMVGTLQPGAVDYRISHPRNASRALSSVADSSVYYLSGIVRAKSSPGFSVNGDYLAMGFGSVSGVIGSSGTNISDGFHLGIRRVDSLGGLRLTAMGGNQFFDLGAASTETDYMIVLELQVDPAGTETLSAWASADGFGLQPVLSGQSVETFSSSANLARFVVQQRNGNTNQQTRGWADEMRFGTTFTDVAFVPEPSTALGLLGLLSLSFLRRARRSKG